MANRDGVQVGQTITLRAVFTDADGNFIAPDDDPTVYIYAPGTESATIAEEADAETWTTAAAGPLTPTEIVPGLYELSYVVPAGWNFGPAVDVWDASFSGNRDVTQLTFLVNTEVTALSQQLSKNLALVVELGTGITSLVGDHHLPSTTTLSWLTELNPFCVSVEMVQMTLGPWIEWIPPITLALMIHNSSKLAQFVTPPRVCDPEWYRYAKAQLVIYDIALKAYSMPAARGHGNSSGGSKRLGDLSIQSGGSGASGSIMSSGIDLETFKDMKRQRQEWFLVVNSGACLLPGQSPPAGFAIAGWNAPGRFVNGRLWEEPTSDYPYPVTSFNEKHLRRGHVRSRHGYADQYNFGPGTGTNSRWSKW